MSKIFDLESPLMRTLTKAADLMILNVITFICCIPGIFGVYALLTVYGETAVISIPELIITILLSFPVGAALTGMHYVLLKMVRNEETYIIKSWWKSFKENFKQATAIWLILATLAAVLLEDFMIMSNVAVKLPRIMVILTGGVGVVLLMVFIYVFPVLSHFSNTVINTIKNSFLMSILALPRTAGMVLITGAFAALPLIAYEAIFRFLPLYILFGIALPGFLCALLYNPTFKRFEPEEDKGEEMSTEEEMLAAARALQNYDDEEMQEAARVIQDDFEEDDENESSAK